MNPLTVSTTHPLPGEGGSECTSPALQVGALFVATLPFVVCLTGALRSPPPAGAGDYAQYLLHARAIAAGAPYTATGYLYTPYNVVGPEAYPPGVPLFLAGALPAFSPSLSLNGARIVAAVVSAVTLAVIYAYARRRTNPWVAAGAVAMLGPTFAQTLPEADVPFVLACWTCFLIADFQRERWRWPAIIGLTCAAIAAVLFRSTGLALVGGVALLTVLDRAADRRRLVVPVVGSAMAFVLVGMMLPVLTSYGQYVARSETSLWMRVLRNAWEYRLAVSEALLYPFASPALNAALHAALIGVALVTVLPFRKRTAVASREVFERHARALPLLFAVCLVGILLAFRVAVSRYALPLAPMVVLWSLVGIATLVRWGGRVPARAAGPTHANPRLVAWGPRVAYAVALLIAAGATVRRLDAPAPPAFERDADAQRLFAAVRMAHDSSVAHQRPYRVVFGNPRVLTLHTGADAMPTINAPEAVVRGEWKRVGVTDIVTGSLTDRAEDDSVEAVISRHPSEFRRAFTAGKFTLYRYTGDTSSISRAAHQLGYESGG